MFTMQDAKNIYAFLNPTYHKGNLTSSRVTALIRSSEPPTDIPRVGSDLITPNKISSEMAMEAVCFVLEEIFKLDPMKGSRSNKIFIYNFFTSKGKGKYYKDRYRISISHTFLKAEVKSKRPNITKSEKDCIKKYQAYWLPVRAKTELDGSWSIVNPHVPKMFIDKMGGGVGCRVSIIDIPEEKANWESAIQVGQMSLITLAYSLRSTCADIIRLAKDKSANQMFLNSAFCSYFYLLKTIIEVGTGANVIPYLDNVDKNIEMLKSSDEDDGILDSFGYTLGSDCLAYVPNPFYGLIIAQYEEEDVIKDLILSLDRWSDSNNEKVQSLIRSYPYESVKSIDSEFIAVNPPILQLLIPNSYFEIKYQDQIRSKDVTCCWKYFEPNTSLMIIGNGLHNISDFYTDIDVNFFMSDLYDGEISDSITNYSFEGVEFSISFLCHMDKSGDIKYLLSSCYFNLDLVKKTYSAPIDIEAIFKDGSKERIIDESYGFIPNDELRECVCSSFKLAMLNISNFEVGKNISFLASEYTTSNIPKSRMYSILIDSLRYIGINIKAEHDSITFEGRT